MAATKIFRRPRPRAKGSTRDLSDSIEGFTCCSQYKYYAFPRVGEREAPVVDFNLTSGFIKALYWRYDTCPIEDVHVVDGVCEGWCVVDFLTSDRTPWGTSHL